MPRAPPAQDRLPSQRERDPEIQLELRKSPRRGPALAGKNLTFSDMQGYSRSSDGGCRAAQSQVYHYTQRVTLYVVVHLRCCGDVAFELGSGITSGLRLHRRRAWTQMKS